MKVYENLNQCFLYAVFLVFVWCWAGCGTQESSLQEPSNTANGVLVEEFSALMNQHRTTVGCAPLADHAGLNQVAQQHSEDMYSRKYFNHVNPEGRNPFDRIALANIGGWTSAGENIAQNPGGAQAVLTAWLNSPGHRANIENCSYTHQGIGEADGYWTHMFLTEN